MEIKILNEADVYGLLGASVPSEETLPIAELLESQFGHHLRDEESFDVVARYGKTSFLLTVSLFVKSQKGTIFEFFVPQVQDLVVLHRCPEPVIDFLGHVLTSFFEEDRDARLPMISRHLM